MATLVLAVAGNKIGGQFGQAVGAAIGQRIDQRLFGPKGRQGPRLGDLAVQSSIYGAPIPKLYGTNRVAGTVIWSTDLREDKRKVSAGKGQPKSTQYSYSASFAVALSARRIVRIGRIWADGKLLRGVAGDFKTQTGFRLHDGTDDQAVDPLISATEGAANAPAYRGLAYAVFENMQLADFGNRIPSLSFEVIADEGSVAVGKILNDLGGDEVLAQVPTTLGGFAALGDTVRAVAESLEAAVPFSAQDDGLRLNLSATAPFATSLAEFDLGSTGGGGRVARIETDRRSASSVPETLVVAHYEIARDFQQGVQRARRDGGGRREQRIELPVVLEAGAAKAIVEARLTRIWAERVSARVRLPWRRLDLRIGQQLNIADSSETWRIAGISFEGMVLEVQLVRHSGQAAISMPAEPGRSLVPPDLQHGPTTFHLIDLPPLAETVATSPALVVAAAGVSPGWRSAALLVSTDGGANWSEAGNTALPATMGVTQGVLGTGSPRLIDRNNSVDVAMLNAEMHLNDADENGIRAGRNLAIIGDELLQFRTATPLSAGHFRLSGLSRGMRGTEWAIAGHQIGDRFVLFETDALAALNVIAGTAEVRVLAISLGDASGGVTQAAYQPSAAVLPPAPVHLKYMRLPNGDVKLEWVRRSRDGWRWADGADAPLGEETEVYKLDLAFDVGSARTAETAIPEYIYTNAARLADIAGGGAFVTATVRQAGVYGHSRPAGLTFPLI